MSSPLNHHQTTPCYEKKLLTVSLALLSFTLAACDSKTPSDEIASKSVLKIAQRDACNFYDVEIDDFKRSNGWSDQNNLHQYDVRFDYNLRLTKPLALAILDQAKAIEKSRKDSADQVHREGATSEFLHSLDNAPADQSANEWWAAQGDKAKPRLAALIKDCAECQQFLTEESHAAPFILAWHAFEDLRFQDNAQIGAKVSREAWVGFTKTENGWMPVNDVTPSGDS